MANKLKESNNELVSVDYSDLLKKILGVLCDRSYSNPFFITYKKGNSERLTIDMNAIARRVIKLSPDNPLGASGNSVRAATVNFSPGFAEDFPKLIEQIRKELKQLLELEINKQHNKINSIQELASSLLTSLEEFKGNRPGLDFTYPFDNYKNLQKQRITFNKSAISADKMLRLHKLTISVEKNQRF